MFWLIYITMNIENVLQWLECRQGDQSDSASSRPHPGLFSGRLAAPYFEINVLRLGLFSGQESGSSYKSLTLLHFGLGAANDAQNVRADTGLIAERITTSRIY